MTLHRNALVILVVAAIAATSITPTFARPNNGAYARSGEAFRKQLATLYCAGMKADLAKAEKKADELAGTKDAKMWADAADKVWADAHDLGCAWAA